MVEHPVWASLNFAECSYEQGGRTWPMFNMTEEGYAFIIGKMTGKMAVDLSLVRLRCVTVR